MGRRKTNLLTCAEVRSKRPAIQFAAYAQAYLDAAQRLCSSLTRSSRKATFERGFVVLYLMAHSVELFLKGAILRKASSDSLLSTHNLVALENRYKKLYPKKRFHFVVPFHTDYALLSPAQQKLAKASRTPIDQLYRYPQDQSGKVWPGVFAFEANSCLKDIVALRSDYERLLVEYDT
jgi:hypothetical protein